MHIYICMNSRKRVLMNLVENGLVHQVRGDGAGGMCGETNMETYITICKIDNQWEFAV